MTGLFISLIIFSSFSAAAAEQSHFYYPGRTNGLDGVQGPRSPTAEEGRAQFAPRPVLKNTPSLSPAATLNRVSSVFNAINPLPPEVDHAVAPVFREEYQPVMPDIPGPERNSSAACETRSIREKFGEVRSQDGLGWCFASVAADFLSFYGKMKVSSFGLALRSYSRAQRSAPGPMSELFGGQLDFAINQGVKGGVCLESELPSNDYLISRVAAIAQKNGQPMTDKELRSAFASFLVQALNSAQALEGKSLQELAADEEGSCRVVTAIQLMFPKLTTFQILSAFTSTRSSREAFDLLVSFTCRPSPPKLPKNFSWIVAHSSSRINSKKGKDLLPLIDSLVTLKQPVAIIYDLKPFMQVEDSEFKHVSIVVGREFRDGKCQYLVRNSFGPACGGYRPPYNDNRHCDRGHFWITEEDIKNHVVQAEFAR